MKFAARFRAPGSIADGDVLGQVVVGGGDRTGFQAGDGARSQAADACGEGVGHEGGAVRRGAVAVLLGAVGLGDGLAELGDTRVHLERDREALGGDPAHVALPDRVDREDDRLEGVELVLVRAGEGAHALQAALLAAGQDDPYVEVARWLLPKLLRQGQGHCDAGCVVVRARDDLGEAPVDEEERADEEDQRGDDLEDRQTVRVDAGHASAEHGEEDRGGPEEEAGVGEGQEAVDALRDRCGSLAEDRSGPGGVDVGGEDQLVRCIGVLAARDDVLRRAAEEEKAQEVAARVEVEVEGRGREEEQGESGDRYLDREDAGGAGEKGVESPDERRLRVDVDGLDLGAAPRVAQARGHGVGGAAL